MNSGSEKKLSMDELLEKNRPAQMVQTTLQPPAQELTLPPEVHPTKAEWEDLQSDLYTLGYADRHHPQARWCNRTGQNG